jgi:hypothetical protein
LRSQKSFEPDCLICLGCSHHLWDKLTDSTRCIKMSLKESLWLSCREKHCCYSSVVIPTGHDIWRIARQVGLPPTSFLVYFKVQTIHPDCFKLDHSGQLFRLAFEKRAIDEIRPGPCVFLNQTLNGSHICSLGELRPLVCKSFPVELHDNLVVISPECDCTCRRWSLCDINLREERERLQRLSEGANEYHSIVAKWNRLVSETPSSLSADFAQYCSYLIQTYDSMQTGIA